MLLSFATYSGAILKVRNDGSLMPELNHSMSLTDKIFDSEQADQDFIYILPRNDDKLWLGGLVQPNPTNSKNKDEIHVAQRVYWLCQLGPTSVYGLAGLFKPFTPKVAKAKNSPKIQISFCKILRDK